MRINKHLGFILQSSGLGFAIISILAAKLLLSLNNTNASTVCAFAALGGLAVFLTGLIIDSINP